MGLLGGLMGGIGNAVGGIMGGVGNAVGGLLGGQAPMKMPQQMSFRPPMQMPQGMPNMGPTAGHPMGMMTNQQPFPMKIQPMQNPNMGGPVMRPIGGNPMGQPGGNPMGQPGGNPMGQPGGINPVVQKSMQSFMGNREVYPMSNEQGQQLQQAREAMQQQEFQVGDLAKYYEVNAVSDGTLAQQAGFISGGMGGKDPGGISYGPYQLESKLGTLQEYLRSDNPYSKQLKQYSVNSPEFKSQWKKLAESDPKGFIQSQFDYLANKPNGYYSALKYAKDNGWNTDSFALKSAIFSTSNQSGGWKNGIFKKAGIQPGDSTQTQINKLYDARANYFSKLRHLDPQIRRNIIKSRTVDERRRALALIGQ